VELIGDLLDEARAGDEDAFRRLAEPHRREIELHCYRMLGSLHDAEDATQETFLRAWRHLPGFEGRSSFRAWLYRIATNCCLTSIAHRPPRLLPQQDMDPLDGTAAPVPADESVWLGPYPDALLDLASDPSARYEQREAVGLAFVAALQLLPGRQRAALILRDVLAMSAKETADILETSVASANSALQRARTSIRSRLPGEPAAKPGPELDELLDRYVRAWEAKDIAALIALLRHDAIMSMPPYGGWVSGRDAIGAFLADVVMKGRGATRLERAGANGQPAFITYEMARGEDEWRTLGIMVLTVRGTEIAEITAYPDPSLVASFQG
jgi:RNA polymerase sigma-70 factor (ECF subfamily)